MAVALLTLVVVIGLSAWLDSGAALNEGQATAVKSSFSFSDRNATAFFESLSTPSGLLRVYPGSNTIYLSDDQQLDQAALTKLGDISLAGKINATMEAVLGGLYGGFNTTSCSYGYWNGVDVVLGAYMPVPCQGSEWNMYSGKDVSLGQNYSPLPNNGGFVVKETEWGGPMGSGYTQYADLELYYCINLLHYGDYADAVAAFQHANSFWNGQGFADQAYNQSEGYTSYKLALDLIAFKALMNNSHTEASVVSYNSTLNQVQGIMSQLQGSEGGVITNYLFVNGQVVIPPNTYENGETTSLFVLAE